MDKQLRIVTAQEGFLYAQPGDAVQGIAGELTDAVLSGWAVEVLREEADCALVRTAYAYEGWMRTDCLQPIDRAALLKRQDRAVFLRVRARSVDLLSEPRVQGGMRETLLQDAVVELLESSEGWSFVRSAAGCTGWVMTACLAQRRFGEDFLLAQEPERKDLFVRQAEQVRHARREEDLRHAAAQSARSYLGCMYRWGGKSPAGIDCSGLVFMSWLEQGITLFRDAAIEAGFPVREIPREGLQEGDLLFFPGHVAMYLGRKRYLHATGAVGSPGVRINSLDPDAPDFRADLAEQIEQCGSVF